MEPNFKRRKTDHFPNNHRDTLIEMAHLPTASTFTLESDELLKEVQADYDGSFIGAVDLLKELRGVINDTEPHDPIPVRRGSSQPSLSQQLTYHLA